MLQRNHTMKHATHQYQEYVIQLLNVSKINANFLSISTGTEQEMQKVSLNLQSSLMLSINLSIMITKMFLIPSVPESCNHHFSVNFQRSHFHAPGTCSRFLGEQEPMTIPESTPPSKILYSITHLKRNPRDQEKCSYQRNFGLRQNAEKGENSYYLGPD